MNDIKRGEFITYKNKRIYINKMYGLTDKSVFEEMEQVWRFHESINPFNMKVRG